MFCKGPVANGNHKKQMYARISVLQTEANLCLFDLFNVIAAISFLYLGHKQEQSSEAADPERWRSSKPNDRCTQIENAETLRLYPL